MNYTPIASKSFGIDEQYGMEKRLYVFRQTSCAKTEIIYVYYDIVLISPTGLIGSVLSQGQYERSNVPGNEKFNQLRESEIGIGTSLLIQSDLDSIISFESITEDLKQTIPTNNP